MGSHTPKTHKKFKKFHKEIEELKTILNVAAGKILPLNYFKFCEEGPVFLINNDMMYYDATEPEYIEEAYENGKNDFSEIFYCKRDIFEFLERTKINFDLITIYRFLEHVPFDRIEYFIYLLSTVTKLGSIIDVIVPDYEILAKMLLKEKINKDFHANDIILTTEILNQPPDPHASIWTEKRAKYFFELEKRFIVNKENIQKNFYFDRRDIYLRFLAERV